MSDKAQRILLGLLAFLLVGGTVIALRSARGGRPLAGLPSRPADDPATRDQGIQFKQVTISGREAGRVAWTLRANKVAVARAQDRMVFEGGVTFDRMRTPPPATSSSRVRGGARPRPAAPPTRSVAAPQPAFSVRAERAEVNGQQNHFLFSGSPVTARLLKPDGRTVAGMLTSPSASGSATYNQSGRTLRLAGSAVTGTFGDLKVKAAQVDWIEDTNVIRCAGTVRAMHPRGEMSGNDLSVDLNTRHATLHDAQGRMAVDKLETALKTLGNGLP